MRSYYFETFFICCVLIFGLQLNAQDDSVNFEAVVSLFNNSILEITLSNSSFAFCIKMVLLLFQMFQLKIISL